MSRPHLEFVQAQAFPWRKSPLRDGAEEKLLSLDPETGAKTAIIRYPAGWRADGAGYEGLEEGFVLRGGLSRGEDLLPEGTYYYWPPGLERTELMSPSGADVLTFVDPPAQPQGLAPLLLDTAAMDWSGNVDPNVVAGSFGKKVLREDPQTGERVWLLMLGPAAAEAIAEVRIETHPHVEEVFLLDGEITMPMGTMKPGGYIWRPGGIAHGPNASIPGCLGFFRSVGGPMVTDWSDEPQRVDFDPPYAPVCPEDIKLQVQGELDLRQPY